MPHPTFPSAQDRAVTLLGRALARQDLDAVTALVDPLPDDQVTRVLERLGTDHRAVVYRLLPKDTALAVFERLDASLQGELVGALREEDVASTFAELEPDDRVGLLDELPASVATRLMQGLPDQERDLTAVVLGYPAGSIARRMSPEYVTTRAEHTARQALDRVRSGLADAETVYTVPVIDDGRKVLGVVSLRALLRAAPEAPVSALMRPAYTATVTDPAENAARRCANLKVLALPVVDAEGRLVGILTVDDALRILEDADSEDQARMGGSEPLRRPYLATPVLSLVRSRVVWLLVLAIGATLTVQVLEVFEQTLEQMVVLSVFIPLLIGTGGNTGNQAATTVTRALALEDVTPGDIAKVMLRELRVGLSLGLALGTAGFAVTSVVYDVSIGTIIGLTLASICTMAATVGGAMPLIAKAIGVDPAVFSNPFITTFVDATGLLVYFFIARAVLGL
ncbi:MULTISPECIES: magnesium transporter [Micrococcaceae]|uniref:magnesium transporter n=1 Tax=Micrococcaceae TaxID=1268 RepID=UPI001620389F|nr:MULTISPECIES: magnesium transporter [Micrococcaceae]MBB5750144.1 magnesium transporter [Micrococcus sp. TA1]HRO31651.1 magnesium transporter [Citricoccus sp.]HRO95352.1 magnesium transporter [Citricoccus sp.]